MGKERKIKLLEPTPKAKVEPAPLDTGVRRREIELVRYVIAAVRRQKSKDPKCA